MLFFTDQKFRYVSCLTYFVFFELRKWLTVCTQQLQCLILTVQVLKYFGD